MMNKEELKKQNECEKAVRYIDLVIGDSIGDMTLREIADEVEMEYELDDEDVMDILTRIFALDFTE